MVDDNELRAQLEAIVKGARNFDTAAHELLLFLLAFGDVRHQEGDEAGYKRGRQEAARDVIQLSFDHRHCDPPAQQALYEGCRAARGEG